MVRRQEVPQVLIVLVLLSGVVVAACQPPSKGQAESLTAGHYIWGAEVNDFRPCGLDSLFWVRGAPDVLQQLRTAHDSLTDRPYEPIYVEVEAHRSFEPLDGFAEETNGYLTITQVRVIRPASEVACEG
jgi:hypothetical protein